MEIRPLTLSQMARRLGVSTAWLRAEAQAARVPALPAGDTFLFCPEVVEQTLLARASQPASPAAPADAEGER